MLRLLAISASLLLGLGGCTDAKAPSEDDSITGEGGFAFTPPEAGRGVEVNARITSGASVFTFDTTELALGDGVTVNSVTVLDGWTATASLSIDPATELGPRDAEIHTPEGGYSIGEALTIVDDSFTITPDRARIGELVQVEIVGLNTEWAPGSTWANFGDDIEVTNVDVLSETYAIATLSVSREAVPGFRNVSLVVGPDVTTLYDGFQVDRVSLSATFDPIEVTQGETVEFSITGAGTHFTDRSDISFWMGGLEKGDVVVDSITVIDSEHMWGQMTVSNAAELDYRDVMVETADEGVFIQDAFNVLGAEFDLSDVGISLSFDVYRGIDNATGAISEQVVGQAIFYLPLDPACPNSPETGRCTDGIDNDSDGFVDCYDNDCSSDPACGGGPSPYDANGYWQTYVTGGSSDCPNNITVGAGEHVYFESPCNVVTLNREVDGATGMIYYTAALTLDDYCFDQMYDLHTEGEEGGIGEYLLPEVQPTVPYDFELLTPEFWGNLTVSRAEDFTYTWRGVPDLEPTARTYAHDPEAYFVTSINGILVETGEGGYAGALPWDDGIHTYTPAELGVLEPGNVSFAAYSVVPEGPTFGFPFSTNQSNYSSSVVYVQGSMVLE